MLKSVLYCTYVQEIHKPRFKMNPLDLWAGNEYVLEELVNYLTDRQVLWELPH
jgi:hypothetical protein